MYAQFAVQPDSRVARTLDWIIRILLALTFVVAGIMKWSGAEISVSTFEAIGFGQWFRYLTGALEIAGGLLVLVPSKSFWAALLLICVMVGALITHLMIGGNAVPAVVMFVLCASVLWLRRAQLAAFRRSPKS